MELLFLFEVRKIQKTACFMVTGLAVGSVKQFRFIDLFNIHHSVVNFDSKSILEYPIQFPSRNLQSLSNFVSLLQRKPKMYFIEDAYANRGYYFVNRASGYRNPCRRVHRQRFIA